MTLFNRDRFNQDWAVGKAGEDAFTKQCKIWDMEILFQAPDNVPFADFDFEIEYRATYEREKYPGEKINGIAPVTWEVKMDMGRTDNIPVQFYSSSKKPTGVYLPGSELSCNAGIYRTKARMFTIFNPFDNTFYIAPADMLRDFLEKSPKIRKTLANRHKPEQTGIALIPKKVWLSEFYHLPYTAGEI